MTSGRFILFILIALFTVLAKAQTMPPFHGGRLLQLDNPEITMGLVCLEEDSGHKFGCRKVKAMLRVKESDQYFSMGEFSVDEQGRKKIIKRARQEYGNRLHTNMGAAYVAPTYVALVRCLLGGMPGMCLMLPAAVAFDVVKFPLVAATHVSATGVHHLNADRFRRHLDFMLNPKNRHEEKPITKGGIGAMAAAFRLE